MLLLRRAFGLFAAGVSTVSAAIWATEAEAAPAPPAAAEPTAPSTQAVAAARAQSAVVSDGKAHAAYVWIHLSPTADVREVARVAAHIHKLVDHVSPPADRDEENEVLTAVGFGPRMWSRIGGKTYEPFEYKRRDGQFGSMPATGGDVFVHIKSDSYGSCFDMVRLIKEHLDRLTPGAIAAFDDRYGFVYKEGRDLSGFIDGTANVTGDEERRAVCLLPHGGAFVMTQRWVHPLPTLRTQSRAQQEQWVGRHKADSTPIEPAPVGSHVERMVGNDASGRKIEIYRQSMPYGRVASDAGLFFIAYFKSPSQANFMLDRMVGATDGINDGVMNLTRCVSGNYWYVPSEEELAELRKL